ncbi:hypothetical protein ACFQ3T_30675, partial [Saccharothrix hoggarensis]
MTPPEKPEDKTAVITRPGAEPTPADGAEKPAVDASGASEQPEAPAADRDAKEAARDDHHAAAPPPWQRVTTDAQYAEAQQVGPDDLMSPPEQQTVEAQQPAYPANDPDTVAVARPVVTGSAAPGGARTQVNLGAANGGR